VLASELAGYRGQPDAVLLALPRGGVPVAAAIAQSLNLPLDVLPVHKIGAPMQPEYAVGAVASDGLVVLDEEAIAAMHISRADLDSIVAREQEELLRREREYRDGRPALALDGKVAILIDDGLATGYTMLVAVHAARRERAARVVVAVPVAPQETINRLRKEADEVVCAYVPPRLLAVGQFYENFGQVSDEEVRADLASNT
jgi:putative phosphoribosyl transferase